MNKMEHQSTTSKTAQHYDELAEQYDERWAKYLEHTHRRFLGQIHTQPDDIILDLSCGTGLLAQHLVNLSYPYKNLVLNDIATTMQQKAKERFDHRDDITFSNHSAEQLGFPDQTFDKICCLNAFHNYYHQSKVLAECHRVLKPGGRFFVLDWNRSGWFSIKNQLIKIMGSEHIDTRSLTEIKQLLLNESFHAHFQEQWYYRSWKFFFIISHK